MLKLIRLITSFFLLTVLRFVWRRRSSRNLRVFAHRNEQICQRELLSTTETGQLEETMFQIVLWVANVQLEPSKYSIRNQICKFILWKMLIFYAKCSKQCGRGFRQRQVYCVFNNTQLADDLYCESERPVDAEECNEHSCPYWLVSKWSECSKPCRSSRRHRNVTCFSKGQNVDESQCNQAIKPIDSELCTRHDCPAWKAGDWSIPTVNLGRAI